MNIVLPQQIRLVLDSLEQSGYSAQLVGGCVRDCLLGKSCDDWDITTNASPEQICAVFADRKLLMHGIKHGTVTVVIDKKPIEITTYRRDGDYSDNRHPDEVLFTSELREDLSRRDFTVNAMCYNEKDGLTDLFGGREDLNAGIIRTVGDADTRFNEDALRIMRALRFASVLGFNIEPDTALSLHKNRQLLKNISAERLFSELKKLVTGRDACRILLEYGDVLGVFIPDILPAIGFEQYGKKHCYTVWEHICHTVGSIEPDNVLRLTMLLHDLGKVPTAARNAAGDSTFTDHAAVGAKMAAQTLTKLHSDTATLKAVVFYIEKHDFEIPVTLPDTRRLLSAVNAVQLKNLLLIKTADRGALAPEYRDVSAKCAAAREYIAQIERESLCCTLSQLAINGNDLLKAGFTGEHVGSTLNALLEAVINEQCPNTKSDLLRLAQTQKADITQ